MSQPASSAPGTQLAQQMRQRFVAEVGRAMVELVAAVQERLTTLLNEAAPSREMQSRRDIWTLYQSRRNAWLEGTLKDWRLTLSPPALAPKKSVENGFELVGTEVVENKIVASRLVLHVMEKVSLEFNDLRVRIKRLEGREDLEDFDILRPEVLLLLMIEQWAIVGMPRDAWPLVNEVAYKLMTERINQAYLNANNFLIDHGVMPTRSSAAPSCFRLDRAPRFASSSSRLATRQRKLRPPAPISSARTTSRRSRMAGSISTS